MAEKQSVSTEKVLIRIDPEIKREIESNLIKQQIAAIEADPVGKEEAEKLTKSGKAH